MTKTYFGLKEFNFAVEFLKRRILAGKKKYNFIHGIPQGGIPLAMELSRALNLVYVDNPLSPARTPGDVLVVDDVVDSGKTLSQYHGTFDTATIHVKAHAPIQPTYFAFGGVEEWIVYWWEGSEDKSISDAVLRQLEYIGENPSRDGLKETPERVVRSWSELYSGYGQNPADIFKIFDLKGYSEMVLLKDIEFYSMCEHHLLPFVGRAHIAYIPRDRVVGISKLARLLEIYARRAQIQERLCKQITDDIMLYLEPMGAACVIEAEHFCMRMRGVNKQQSKMTTASLTGVFLENPGTRAEFMGLIK